MIRRLHSGRRANKMYTPHGHRFTAFGKHQGSGAKGGVPWMLSTTLPTPAGVDCPNSVSQYLNWSNPYNEARETDDALTFLDGYTTDTIRAERL